MFKKEGGEVETIIGPSVQVEGNFSAAGDVIIEGTVSGSVKTDGHLRVGAGARIFADVTAASAIIAGEIQGNVRIHDNAELTNTAKVFGDFKAQTLTISPGAALHGKCSAGEEKKSRLEKINDQNKQKVHPILSPVPEKIK